MDDETSGKIAATNPGRAPSSPPGATRKPPAALANNHSSESSNTSTNPNEISSSATPAISTDGAVGVPAAEWFIAIVSPRAEKKIRDNLLKKNIEAYAAVRTEQHIWRRNERKAVDRVVIPCVVFIRTVKTELESLRKEYNLLHFMRDVARKQENGMSQFAIVTDKEIATLQAMLRQDEFEVAFAPSQFTLGEHVRILDFNLVDDFAQVVHIPTDNKSYVGLRIKGLGCAYMQVPLARIVKLSPERNSNPT